MSLNNRPVPRRKLRISLPKVLTPEQQAALRNIEATEEARKTDPSIYHVQEVDPELHRYPTPEERERLYREAEEWIHEMEELEAKERQRRTD